VAGADEMRTAPIASFGPFRLNPIERRLERNNEAVAIGSRSLDSGERSLDAAREIGNNHDIAIADLLAGSAHHFLGDQEKVQRHLEHGFERAPVAAPVEIDLFGDHHARSRCVLAPTLWLRGFPDRARQVMHQAMDEAEQRGYPVVLGICLIWSSIASLWPGDLIQAAEYIERSATHASRHLLTPAARAHCRGARDRRTRRGARERRARHQLKSHCSGGARQGARHSELGADPCQ
jgi:hypothetical protein